jgi:5-amino-6-(5-phosphoribosylamino)uracil reductase
VVQHLSDRGVQRLLIEGGGQIMWDFVSLNLIDEFHVTLTPRILGGAEAPTLVDGLGFKKQKSLKLKLIQCRAIGDELFLTYRRPSTC